MVLFDMRGDLMIRIAIVDDEEIILKSIRKKTEDLLNELKVDFEIYDYTDGTILLKEFKNVRFDIVFLDIEMPGISGLEIAQRIRDEEENVDIIFITNKDDLVYDSIKFAPFRFIRKFRFETEISEALNKYICKYDKNNLMYVFSTLYGKKQVPVMQIKYIEVKSHKLHIHKINEIFTVSGNLNDIEEIFNQYGFMKIHQSYLVNYRFIKLIKRTSVILDDGTELPLSSGRFEQIQICYMRLSREN